MEFVRSPDQLVENLRTFDSYRLSPSAEAREFYRQRLRAGRQLLVGRIDGAYSFAPSRFVGYAGCTRVLHANYPYKHGTLTTNAINKILGKSAWNERLNQHFCDLCESVGVAPYDVPRAFWLLKDDLEDVSSEALEVEDLIRNRGASGRGQGFGLSAPERRVVEQHAMSIAVDYFAPNWDAVQDVSAHRSYDIHCTREGVELRVEVKGTTTGGRAIILTRNEVREAQAAGYALFVVSEIQLDRTTHPPTAYGGVARYFHPWTPHPASLEPLSYQCSLELLDGMMIDV